MKDDAPLRIMREMIEKSMTRPVMLGQTPGEAESYLCALLGAYEAVARGGYEHRVWFDFWLDARRGAVPYRDFSDVPEVMKEVYRRLNQFLNDEEDKGVADDQE